MFASKMASRISQLVIDNSVLRANGSGLRTFHCKRLRFADGEKPSEFHEMPAMDRTNFKQIVNNPELKLVAWLDA
jgi:hypothetical protein